MTTPEKMNEYLSTVTYQGVANTYSFTDTGDLDPAKTLIWTYKIANGEIVPNAKAPTS